MGPPPCSNQIQTTGEERSLKRRPGSSGSKFPVSEGPLQGPAKHQRLSSGTPEGGQANRSTHIGQLTSARAAQEGLQMAIVCVGYLEAQVSKENFVNIQQAIGGLVDELLKEGFTSRLIDSYRQKEPPLWYARTRRPRTGWVVRYQLLRHGRTLRFKMVGLEALPTYK